MKKNNTDKVFSKKLISNFSSSLSQDKRLYKEDIELSIAYSKALAKINILNSKEQKNIEKALKNIFKEIKNKKFEWRPELEDIHMNIESRLHDLVGPYAGKIHTGKSRNDQIATIERMYVKNSILDLFSKIEKLQKEIVIKAESHLDFVMPSYTHLQRAQPILLSHQLMAYYEMLQRDKARLMNCYEISDELILGSGAVAGSFYKLDRNFLAKELNFKKINSNSIDGVSDRDFIIEFLSSISISMMHLSRISEEFIIWSSEEFEFIELSDDVVTTSSMMPQKRNPDFLELIRGKFGGILGNFISLLVTMKSLPFSYNRDMQEDKKPLLDSVDEFSNSLLNMTHIIKKVRFNKEKLKNATDGNILATDIADLLSLEGMPFREAHIKVSNLTMKLKKQGKVLSDLNSKELNEILDVDFNLKIDLSKSINSRKLKGGTSKAQVKKEIITAKKTLKL
ncbi:MAG: argininosuccinate lyase [Chloroflexota bacterium]|nr:argininosuccinate lyase [Chloroflexota bacterium]